jgi:hypothetical protein
MEIIFTMTPNHPKILVPVGRLKQQQQWFIRHILFNEKFWICYLVKLELSYKTKNSQALSVPENIQKKYHKMYAVKCKIVR